jgi:hypothetical protein
MDWNFVSSRKDDEWAALTGVPRTVFETIWVRFCGEGTLLSSK